MVSSVRLGKVKVILALVHLPEIKGTREQAEVMGEAWVGDGCKVASDGKTLVSQAGLRQYRPPTYKQDQQRTQAKFEQGFLGQETKKW